MRNSCLEREYKYEWDVLYMKCTICWTWRESTQFPIARDNKKFWTRSCCKECYRIKNRRLHQEWYKANSELAKRKCKVYHVNNKEKINNNIKDRAEQHTKDLWFDRYKFHSKAKIYVLKNRLRPIVCPLCKQHGRIEMHHPDYSWFDMWSKVVFCCKKCHSNIHKGHIECPKPINLLDLDKSINC